MWAILGITGKFHDDISQPQIKDRPELAQNRKLRSIKCQELDLIGQTCVY